MMKRFLFCAAAFGAFCFGGCTFLERAEVSEPACYDLGALKGEKVSDLSAEFRSFSDVTGNGVRFVSRYADGRVGFDDMNRFSAPPAQLIRRRLQELFRPAAQEGSLKISGTLCRFELDRAEKAALLLMDYQLSYRHAVKAVRHRITVKTDSFRGGAAAAAFEKCVTESARRLEKDCREFVKECQKKGDKK